MKRPAYGAPEERTSLLTRSAPASSSRLLRSACVIVLTSSTALSAVWSRWSGATSARATTALPRDERQVMHDHKPLGRFYQDDEVDRSDDGDVVIFPPLVTKYAVLPAPDGQIKSFVSWNGGIQGPTRRVRVNQTVRVKLVNELYSDSVTVHHHGVHQVGTPFYDGTSQISQPGVSPGNSMTYEFLAWPAGTHWYHSHEALQLGDGLKGMFIVEDPDDVWKPFYSTDEALMFYEWNWRTAIDLWEIKSVAPETPEDVQTGVVNGIVSKNTSGTNEGCGPRLSSRRARAVETRHKTRRAMRRRARAAMSSTSARDARCGCACATGASTTRSASRSRSTT